MNLIESIADAFIMTVGITPPSPTRRRAAAIFIATGLFGTVAGVVAFIAVIVPRLFSH